VAGSCCRALDWFGVALLWNKIEATATVPLGIALTLVSVCGIGHLAGGRPGLHAG